MNRILFLLCTFLVFGTVARADFNNVPYTDTMARAVKEYVVAETPLVSAGSGMTTGTLVADFDIATSPTFTLNTADLDNPLVGIRTLAIELVDAAGANLNGTVTVSGTNQWNQYTVETVVFEAGETFALTTKAFSSIDSIAFAFKNTGTGDLLNVTPGGLGFQLRATTTGIKQVNVRDGATTYGKATSFTWDPTNSVITALGNTLSEGDIVEIIGWQDVYTRPSGGTITTQAE